MLQAIGLTLLPQTFPAIGGLLFGWNKDVKTWAKVLKLSNKNHVWFVYNFFWYSKDFEETGAKSA
jgi:hypothetical protein